MRNDTIVSREVKPYLPVVKLVAREISLKIMVDNDRGSARGINPLQHEMQDEERLGEHARPYSHLVDPFKVQGFSK
jgi:hypothetical protein